MWNPPRGSPVVPKILENGWMLQVDDGCQIFFHRKCLEITKHWFTSLHFNQTFWWIPHTFWKISNLTVLQMDFQHWFTFSTFDCMVCIGTTLVEVQAAEVAQDLPFQYFFSLHISFWSFHLGKWTITASLHREVEAEPPTHPVSRVWRKGHCVLSEESSRQLGAKRFRIQSTIVTHCQDQNPGKRSGNTKNETIWKIDGNPCHERLVEVPGHTC